MADDLRTRIAAVIDAHRDGWVCACGYNPATGATYEYHVADAVIRELTLGKEFGCGFSDPRHGCRCSHRYVTDWEETEKWQEF